MPWAKDVNLGTTAPGGSGATIALTTTATAAANTWIMVAMGTFGGATLSSGSDNGPGLTWVDVANAANGSVRAHFMRAWAPSGMASGTIITATMSGSTGERKIGAVSFTGANSASALENSATATGSGTAFSVSPTAATSDALVILSAALNTNSNWTNAGQANTVENLDWQFSGSSCAAHGHRIVTSSGSNTVGGTWGASNTWAAIGGAFSLGIVADHTPKGTSAGMMDPLLVPEGWF